MSEKGLAYNNYHYSSKERRGDVHYWQCSFKKKGCKARLIERNFIYDERGVHTCQNYIEKYEFHKEFRKMHLSRAKTEEERNEMRKLLYLPECCADSCTNSAIKGYQMTRFPKAEKRKKLWIENVNRNNWYPKPSSVLCEAHFTVDSWEIRPQDGKRKLKNTAVPTIFPYHIVKMDENFIHFSDNSEPIENCSSTIDSDILNILHPPNSVEENLNINLGDHDYISNRLDLITNVESQNVQNTTVNTTHVQSQNVNNSYDNHGYVTFTVDIKKQNENLSRVLKVKNLKNKNFEAKSRKLRTCKSCYELREQVEKLKELFAKNEIARISLTKELKVLQEENKKLKKSLIMSFRNPSKGPIITDDRKLSH